MLNWQKYFGPRSDLFRQITSSWGTIDSFKKDLEDDLYKMIASNANAETGRIWKRYTNKLKGSRAMSRDFKEKLRGISDMLDQTLQREYYKVKATRSKEVGTDAIFAKESNIQKGSTWTHINMNGYPFDFSQDTRKVYFSLDFEPYLTYLLNEPYDDSWFNRVQKFCDDVVFIFFNLIGVIAKRIVKNPHCFKSAVSAKIAQDPQTLISHGDSIVVHIGVMDDPRLDKKARRALQLVDFQKIAMMLARQARDIDAEQAKYNVPIRIINNKTRREQNKRVVYGIDPAGGGASDSTALAAKIVRNLNQDSYNQMKRAAQRSNEDFIQYMQAWITKHLEIHIDNNMWIRQFISYLSDCD